MSAADELLYVLSSEMVLANPETGEVRREARRRSSGAPMKLLFAVAPRYLAAGA